MPNPQLLRAKGRPMMSRIRNEMDGVTSEGRSELEGDSTEATSGDSILVSDIVRGTCHYLLYG